MVRQGLLKEFKQLVCRTAGAEFKEYHRKSTRSNAFSVMAMSLVSSKKKKGPMTGAGVVICVAIQVNWQMVLKLTLTKVPLKYQGLNGAESTYL